MKVKELIKILQECGPEEEVILFRDREGNGYSPYGSRYLAHSTWSGECRPRSLTEEDRKAGAGEGDLFEEDSEAVDAVLLLPVS